MAVVNIAEEARGYRVWPGRSADHKARPRLRYAVQVLHAFSTSSFSFLSFSIDQLAHLRVCILILFHHFGRPLTTITRDIFAL